LFAGTALPGAAPRAGDAPPSRRCGSAARHRGIWPDRPEDLDIAEDTDPQHDQMIPHTFVLEPDLRIHSVYNGY